MIKEEQNRLKKLEQIKKLGLEPYPARTGRNLSCEQVQKDFNKLTKGKNAIVLAGRLVLIRLHGGAIFAHLDDGTSRFQILFRKNVVGEKQYQFLKELVDLGDFLEVEGSLFTTKTGEKTLEVKKFELLGKTLLPLPEKWHGLEDVEIRYRKRYLDLLADPEVKEIFKKRSLIIKTIREFFTKQGFIEVETPILQPIPGGAAAKPFITHHDTLDIDLYLSIAPELYLKRLIIGGFEKVFEITKCFRNEGIDWSHNPEFTQVEFYQAYADYQDLMNLTERLFTFLFQELKMNYKIKYRDTEIDFTPPYPRKKYIEAIKEYAGLDLNEFRDRDALYKEVKKIGLEVEKKWSWAKIVDEIFKEKVRPKIKNPVFIMNHPVEISPLAKKTPDDSRYVERFQLLAGGLEICNAFSELNDPLDQEERFKAQQATRKSGDEEAQMYDQDFIEAMKHGMPPTAGCGIGIDRLMLLLTGQTNIREVILFPTMRPKNSK